MFARPKEYISAVFKLWGKAISGPALAVVGLLLLVVQLVITDAPTAARVLGWFSYVSLGLALLMVFVAQYAAWKEQYDAKVGADAKVKSIIDALSAPELWLSFQDSNLHRGFTVENRSTDTDGMKVFFDPVETRSYRLESGTLPQVRFGVGAQPLQARMIRKSDRAEFQDVDLPDLLNDTCENYRCGLDLTLRYSDTRGHPYVRRVTISADQVKLKLKFPPEITNHEIESAPGFLRL